MSTISQSGPLGSQRLLQLTVNSRPELLTSSLRKSGALGRQEGVEWRSPLNGDGHREYRDHAALALLGLDHLAEHLRDFWPSRGPVWDALGVTSDARPLLVEAKAHIPEAASPGTKASPASRELIDQSLAEARRWVSPRSKANWTGTFYQYANRLAHQFFLCKRHGINSSLVFLGFTNAVDMDGPATEQEWHGATRLLHAVLGLPADLSAFGVYHAYLDARQLTDAA